MSDYQFNLPVKSDHLKAIGMVATEWSYLESIVEAAIWNLAGLDEDRGESITTHLAMPQRLDMLMTLFRLRHGECEAAKHLKKTCDKIRHDLSRQRGEAIHTRWVEGDQGTSIIYTVRARGKLERSRKGRPAAKIREVAALIAGQSVELLEFLEKHGDVVPPS